jgi:hypothetical protein
MEVKVGPLYKVVITEYEAGWGQRCDPEDTKFFTTLEEAKAYSARWEEGGSYEIFWRGEITKIG